MKRVQGSARTQEDARKKLTELLRQAADFLDYWLKNIVIRERRPKTFQGYEGIVRLHLIPGLGKKHLGNLNAQDIHLFTDIRRTANA
ncbi:hypothetical protein ITP53_03520 [Nonomuraea sp. K274]|uniref:Integrase SAM-like N-terminal domain-containing protein n=1 Tax=Nonomuraea cypriaca TaxID=1187855 RepID=A0A931EWU6_9ACTN|nr:N-terminal phage integrase SAM-like domain-containing protein [Nonomuraea cypriaca]MBF8184822.1 hypothetical protein [Nonomuraea cypriaca]